MSLAIRILFAAVLAALAVASMARAEDAGAAFVVSYIEFLPPSADQALALLKPFAVASRKEDGNVRFEVLRRIAAPHHVAILEVWKDQKAQEAHAASAPVKALRDKLQALQASPYDERPHIALAVGTAGAGAGIHVVTHVDCVGARKDDCMALLKQLSGVSRQESGNLRFDALQQASRPNHFSLVEVWQNEKAVEGHLMAANTRQFREALQPMAGALYDERFYKMVE
jgi:quinol monooxygenase YgiN